MGIFNNLIYIPLTVRSEGIVSNNHMPIELNSTVCTETVCLRKRFTLGSPLSTIGSNVNVKDMSSSDQPLRIVLKTNKQPRK